METNETIQEELIFYKRMVKFKNSLTKSNCGEYLVNLNIKLSKESGKWEFELRDAVDISNDNDLLLHKIFQLDDEISICHMYNKVIKFHTRYAKQSNVRIWCWGKISVPIKISGQKIVKEISLTPIQEEILEIALAKVKSNHNYLSMKFNDIGAVDYNMKVDLVVKEYNDLISKYENYFTKDKEIFYCIEYHKSEKRNCLLEERQRLQAEINGLFKDEGLYIKKCNEYFYYGRFL